MVYQKSRKRYSRKRTSRKRTSRKRYSHKKKVQDGGSTLPEPLLVGDSSTELSQSLPPDDSSVELSQAVVEAEAEMAEAEAEVKKIRETARTNCIGLWERFQDVGEQGDVTKEVMVLFVLPNIHDETLGNFISKLVEHIGTEDSCKCVDNIVNKGITRRKIRGRRKYNGVSDFHHVHEQIFNIVKYIMNPSKTNTTQRRQICKELIEIAKESINQSQES